MDTFFKILARGSFLIVFAALFSSAVMPACERKEPVLIIETRAVQHLDSIIHLTDSLVQPILYKGSINLNTLPVPEKKQKFYDIMLPAVLVAKHNFTLKRERIQRIELELSRNLKLSKEDSLYLAHSKKEFKAKDTAELLEKLLTPPTSIILAQAAIESGWGTSRFFSKANNIFGIWSYNRNEPRIKALESRAGKGIYVRKYASLSASVEDYLKLLARAGVYKQFRELCQEKDDPLEMLEGLRYYSELREQYVAKLDIVMRVNRLIRFDRYMLNPESFQ